MTKVLGRSKRSEIEVMAQDVTKILKRSLHLGARSEDADQP